MVRPQEPDRDSPGPFHHIPGPSGSAYDALSFRVLGPIGPEEISLAERSVKGREGAALMRIRAKHHRVAILVAEGKSNADIARLVGGSPQTYSTLRRDPAFIELVCHYCDVKAEQYVDLHARLAGAGLTALEILSDRMEEEPESLASSQLIEILKATLDRAGYAPRPQGGGNPGMPGLSVTASPGAGGKVQLNIAFTEPPAAADTIAGPAGNILPPGDDQGLLVEYSDLP